MVRINSYEEYRQAYEQSVTNPEQFWNDIANQFQWRRPWDKVLEWDFKKPDVKWFINGKLNITENCIDRHLQERGDQPAIIWEPNDKKEAHKVISYKELHMQVNRFAQVLRNNGV